MLRKKYKQKIVHFVLNVIQNFFYIKNQEWNPIYCVNLYLIFKCKIKFKLSKNRPQFPFIKVLEVKFPDIYKRIRVFTQILKCNLNTEAKLSFAIFAKQQV